MKKSITTEELKALKALAELTDWDIAFAFGVSQPAINRAINNPIQREHSAAKIYDYLTQMSETKGYKVIKT